MYHASLTQWQIIDFVILSIIVFFYCNAITPKESTA